MQALPLQGVPGDRRGVARVEVLLLRHFQSLDTWGAAPVRGPCGARLGPNAWAHNSCAMTAVWRSGSGDFLRQGSVGAAQPAVDHMQLISPRAVVSVSLTAGAGMWLQARWHDFVGFAAGERRTHSDCTPESHLMHANHLRAVLAECRAAAEELQGAGLSAGEQHVSTGKEGGQLKV